MECYLPFEDTHVTVDAPLLPRSADPSSCASRPEPSRASSARISSFGRHASPVGRPRLARAASTVARQAGFDLSFAGAEGELPESDFYILPSGEGYDAYSVAAWRRVLDKVAGGAALLVTKGGKMALADFRAATGNEIDYSEQDTPSETEFELAAHPGRCLAVRSSSTVRIAPRESRVLGATADGDAMATVSDYGKGRVIFVNAPIERDAFLNADAFAGENPNPLYLVYREAAKIAGVRRVVEKGDCPCIGLTEHPAGDGRTIVVAVNHEPREVECPVRIKGALVRVWRGMVADSRIVLSPNDAAVFEVS